MKLSANFSLSEFLISQTAERNGIDMTPPVAVVNNLKILSETILQPLREQSGYPIIISSGYRPELLNTMIGGSPKSAHKYGRAADISSAKHDPMTLAKMIRDMQLPYDQLILEFGRWVHVGIADPPRGEILTAYLERGRTVYTPYLIEVGQTTRGSA